MPIKVAFWNINTGHKSYETRLKAFTDWCAKNKPDLLILEEVSFTLEQSIEKITGMQEIVHAATLNKHLKPSTKQLWALQKKNLDFTGHAIRLPDLSSVRLALKVSSNKNKLAIWGLHAKASYSGGHMAVLHADKALATDDKIIIGGDFNCPIDWALQKVQNGNVGIPSSWQNNYLRFSQWDKEEGTPIPTKYLPIPDLHLQTRNTGYLTPKPSKNGVIDFVIAGTSRNVTAVPNCSNEEEWINIIKNFDHCPVVFNIS